MKPTLYLLALLALALPGNAMELFVGPNGKNTNPGTKAKPLASLEAARDRLRACGGGKHTITLRAGVYPRTASFTLDQRDTGLTLRGEPGARMLGGKVIIDGMNEQTVETVGNTIVKDPADVSLDRRTYAVRAPGFSPIPFKKIGLYPDRYRPRWLARPSPQL